MDIWFASSVSFNPYQCTVGQLKVRTLILCEKGLGSTEPVPIVIIPSSNLDNWGQTLAVILLKNNLCNLVA